MSDAEQVAWYLARWCQRETGLGRAPTDAEFDAWLKEKGL